MEKDIRVEHLLPPSNSEDMKNFLLRIDNVLTPRLSLRVDICEYSKKLARLADVFNAYVEGKFAGSVVIYMNSGQEGFVSSFTVFPEYQRQGVGTKLWSEVVKDANRRGINRISLDVYEENHKAIKFYAVLGFKLQEEINDWRRMEIILEKE